MGKAILVIDMPKSCEECPICASWQSSAFSIREYWCTAFDNIDVYPDDKPRWCPLKPAPEKSLTGNSDYYQWGDWEDGWNSCVDSLIDE